MQNFLMKILMVGTLILTIRSSSGISSAAGKPNDSRHATARIAQASASVLANPISPDSPERSLKELPGFADLPMATVAQPQIFAPMGLDSRKAAILLLLGTAFMMQRPLRMKFWDPSQSPQK